MADDKILERVRNLIARSASSEEEEARTSAMLACELIRKHKLEIVLPRTGQRPPVNWPQSKPKAWHSSPSAGQRAPKSTAASTPVSTIVIGYPTFCNTCGLPIAIGSEVQWRLGRNVVHMTCDPGSL